MSKYDSKWNQEQVEKLSKLYPITQNWDILLKEFPFSTKRGIQGTAANLGLRKIRKNHARNRHREDLFNTWTEISAYLAGYLEADGYLNDEKLALTVTFATSIKDKEYLEQLKSLVEFTGKTSIRTYKLLTGTYQGVAFTVRSRTWKESLLTSIRKGQIPSDIPNSLLHHYIRGYFDGDGSIFWSKQAKCYHSNFVFGDLEFAKNFVARIELLLGPCTLYKKTSSDKCWYINLGKAKTINLRKYMYNDAHIFLKRKEERFRMSQLGSSIK